MTSRLALLSLSFAIFIISGCQNTPINVPITGQEPIRVIPVNVLSEFIAPQAITPEAIFTPNGNIFNNSGFESGLTGWGACDLAAIELSTDAYEGTNAAKVNAGKCFYRSAAVNPEQTYTLSCYAKILSGSAWTGMGMGFSDVSFNEISQAPVAIISGASYARYDTKATSPANARYVSMWFYTDNPAVVDNCSLLLDDDQPEPPTEATNLLESADFRSTNSVAPIDWTIGCGGTLVPNTTNVSLQNGACFDQGLSAGDIAVLEGKNFNYSCSLRNVDGYASMSIFLDGVAQSKAITTTQGYPIIELSGTAPAQLSNGFVSLYGEGTLNVQDCTLTVESPPEPDPQPENLLQNPYLTQKTLQTDGVTNLPSDWLVGCAASAQYVPTVTGGTSQRPTSQLGSYREFVIENGTCFDQRLIAAANETLSGKNYSLACHVMNGGFITDGGYAALTISFDGQVTSEVIPNIQRVSGSPIGQFVEITGTAPVNASDVFISLYSEGELAVYDCSLSLTTDVIQISDWVLSRQIRSDLALTDATPINKSNILSLNALTYVSSEVNPSLGGICCQPDIRNLQGLEFAENLSELFLDGSLATDFSPLYGLTNLEKVTLRNSGLTTINFLSNMPQVKELVLGNNAIAFPGNRISDISVLLNMPNLVKVDFKNYNGGGTALNTANQAAHDQVIQQLVANGVNVIY